MSIRKPLIIEFTGTPNSGKTTLLKILPGVFSTMGISVEVMQEDAEIVPKTIPKKTWIRNMWITLGQLQSLLEASISTSDIIFLDRGYFDALFWAKFLLVQGVCSQRESDSLLRILNEMNQTFQIKPDVLFLFDVSIEESLKRRATQSNEEVTMSTDSFLQLYKNQLSEFASTVSVPTFSFDTTDLSIIQMQEIVVSKVLELLP